MSMAVRFWEDNFEIVSKITPKSERNALCFALISYGFSGETPKDLNLNKNNMLLFEVLKNNFIAKKQGGAPIGNNNRCSTVEKNKTTVLQPLSENIKHKTENNNNLSDERQIDLEEVIAEKKTPKKDFSAEFEQWWAKYPNKKSKQDALKSFNRVLASKQATLDQLMHGLEAYSNDCKAKNTETHYIKHPSTWLNQGCWADEYGAAEAETYHPSVDSEKLNQMASIAELTKQRMAQRVKLKYGA